MSNLKDTYEFINDKQQQKEYNDEVVRKTWYYQKKFGFKTSPRQGHEFWNNEAVAFKHAYIGADMYLNHSNFFSLWAGMYHEFKNIFTSSPKKVHLYTF